MALKKPAPRTRRVTGEDARRFNSEALTPGERFAVSACFIVEFIPLAVVLLNLLALAINSARGSASELTPLASVAPLDSVISLLLWSLAVLIRIAAYLRHLAQQR